jgi:DNA polymerase-3 subunit beta
MEATCDANDLRDAIAAVKLFPYDRWRGKGRVLLDASEGCLTMETICENVVFHYYLTSMVTKTGSIVVNISLLEKLIAGEQGTIAIEQQGDKLRISGSNWALEENLSVSERQLSTLPDLGPRLDYCDSDFMEMLGRVAGFISTEDGRPILTGVLMHSTDVGTYLVAADGFRMAIAKIPMALPPNVSLVLPGRACAAMSKLITGVFSMEWVHNAVRFRSGKVDILMTAIEGTYPTYMGLIPEEEPTWIIKTPSQELIKRLGQVEGIARLTCSPGPRLNIAIIDDDDRKFQALMKVLMIGSGMVGIKSRYLLEAVEFFKVTQIEVRNKSLPVHISGDIEGLDIWIMPIFLQW